MRVLLRLAPYLRGSIHLLVIVSFLGLAGQGCAILVPEIIGRIVDGAWEQGSYDGVPKLLALLVGIGLLQGLFMYADVILGTLYGQRALRHLRGDLYERLCSLSFPYFDRVRTGQILSRVTSDFEPIEMTITWGMRLCFRSVVLFIGVLIVCMRMDPKLALIGLSTTPLVTITALVIGLKLRPAYGEAREQLGVVSSFLQENLQGIRSIQVYCREREEIRRFDRLSTDLRQKNFIAGAIDAAYFPLTGLWSMAGGLLILWLGGRMVIAGDLSLGDYIRFEMYLIMLIVPMRMLGYMTAMAARAIVAARRVFAIMDAEREPADDESAESPGRIEGAVEFRNVSFSYGDGTKVMRDVSFAVEPGETVGILGATGSGKSTVLNLVSRFYDPEEGAVRVDGKDVRSLVRRDLRRQIGFVFQDPFLFSGTIRENVLVGNPEANEEQIVDACKRAAIHDFITTLEKGYDAPVGERGENLSGGQRQRLSLARALIADPRILVLDDCTSNVDTFTEHRIQEALEEVRKGRTTLVVAQRPSAVATADRVIILDHGRVVEEGDPRKLADDPHSRYAILFGLQEDVQLAS